MNLDTISTKILDGGRIDFDEAMQLYAEADFHELGQLAHQIRLAKHPEPNVTYVVDRNINYSNVCVCGCKFCAFYKEPGEDGGYVLSFEEIGQKIDETVALGGTQILRQGGHHPDLPLSWYEDMLRYIKKHHPVHIHAFSPPEVVFWSDKESIPTSEVIERLRTAGLDSIPGGEKAWM